MRALGRPDTTGRPLPTQMAKDAPALEGPWAEEVPLGNDICQIRLQYYYKGRVGRRLISYQMGNIWFRMGATSNLIRALLTLLELISVDTDYREQIYQPITR